MGLINLDMLEKQNAWHKELENILEGLSGFNLNEETIFNPEVNFYENENNIFIEIDLPSVAKDELKIKYENNYLTVSGEKKTEDDGKIKQFYLNERSSGKFARSFSLPDYVDASKIEAKLENGVLEIVIPKTEQRVAKERKIEIK